MGGRRDLGNPYRKSTFLQRVLNIMQQRSLGAAFSGTSEPLRVSSSLPAEAQLLLLGTEASEWMMLGLNYRAVTAGVPVVSRTQASRTRAALRQLKNMPC